MFTQAEFKHGIRTELSFLLLRNSHMIEEYTELLREFNQSSSSPPRSFVYAYRCISSFHSVLEVPQLYIICQITNF